MDLTSGRADSIQVPEVLMVLFIQPQVMGDNIFVGFSLLGLEVKNGTGDFFPTGNKSVAF
ncbi:MAG: hypothetical protein JNN17_03585 [Verrucomicrobiaceae bacterium]|nr:hypothetical protein [Verrucomicrobiaceae bacterium]